MPLLRKSNAEHNPSPGTAYKQAVARCGPADVCLAIGPEGGFAEDEAALAMAVGWPALILVREFFASKPPRSRWRRSSLQAGIFDGNVANVRRLFPAVLAS